MNIDDNLKYFKMSFKFNKTEPQDFGLVSQNNSNLFIDLGDRSLWEKKYLYDFGWGNENGFMRLPALSFNELWYLLLNNNIEENKYGAAQIILNEYPDELLECLQRFFQGPSPSVNNSLIEAFKILKLDELRNRSNVLGKSYEEIQNDWENWKTISIKVSAILK